MWHNTIYFTRRYILCIGTTFCSNACAWQHKTAWQLSETCPHSHWCFLMSSGTTEGWRKVVVICVNADRRSQTASGKRQATQKDGMSNQSHSSWMKYIRNACRWDQNSEIARHWPMSNCLCGCIRHVVTATAWDKWQPVRSTSTMPDIWHAWAAWADLASKICVCFVTMT